MNALDVLQKSNNIVAISNYKFSKEIEDYASNFDCVIRFNKGSNPIVLSSEGEHFNERIDICALSGWRNGDFGPIDGFSKKTILFSRPPARKDLIGRYKLIYVKNEFVNELKKHTDFISFIPYEVFLDLYKEQNYDHPTTGFITAYYVKKYLNKNIKLINFFIEDKKKLFNYFLKKTPPVSDHNTIKESKILFDLGIENIKI